MSCKPEQTIIRSCLGAACRTAVTRCSPDVNLALQKLYTRQSWQLLAKMQHM